MLVTEPFFRRGGSARLLVKCPLHRNFRAVFRFSTDFSSAIVLYAVDCVRYAYARFATTQRTPNFRKK
jgi:hypothetical protein